MNAKEKWLLERLKNYELAANDVRQLETRLKEIGYKVSATYGLNGGGGSGKTASKIESLILQRDELEREIQEERRILLSIKDAVNHAGLTARERELVICTVRGESLSSYARSRNIYKSSVYKIRDKALEKMAQYIFGNTKHEEWTGK